MPDNIAFKEIMDLDCSEDIKQVVGRWDTVSKNLDLVNDAVQLRLPAMLWYTKAGVGITRLLELLCDFLEEKGNLLSFSGDVPFFEHSLDYCGEGKPFTSFTRLVEALQSAAGFRNRFVGVIRIDVEQWVEHFTEDYFIDFTEFVCELARTNLVILSIESCRADSERFEAFLSVCMRICVVEFTSPSPAAYLSFLTEFFAEKRITITPEAEKILLASIERLTENPYFDGYKTVENLAEDIIYNRFSSCNPNPLLDADAVADFSSESEYISRRIKSSPKTVRKIGFK